MVNQRQSSQMFSFNYTNPTGSNVVNFHVQPYSKYVPFNYLIFKNMTDLDAELYVNGYKLSIIPSGTIFTADSTNVPAIREAYFKISGTSTGTIEVNLQKVKTISGDVNKFYARV